MLYVHHDNVLGEVPPVTAFQFLTPMVHLALFDRVEHRLRLQREMGRFVLYRDRWPLYSGGFVE